MAVCWKIVSLVVLASFFCSSIGQNNNDNVDVTSAINTTVRPTVSTTPAAEKPVACPTEPEKHDEEQQASLHIFFLLIILMFSIFMTHILIKFKFHYLPESVAVVVIGAMIGLVMNKTGKNFEDLEQFQPQTFFIVLLPPIIFESGYSLHKGNFFQNLGSILVFAVIGTAISAVVVGGGMYGLGQVGLVYQFTAIECFAFGSLISAVDPVATLAIFHALDVNPTLNMLVFGESVLNDAVSIVMTRTILSLTTQESGGAASVFSAIWSFIAMFTASAAIGVIFALASAFCLKHVNLRSTPALEFSMLLIFTYMPYGLAEACKLSGIMSVLFCGIVMSHYTHFNLSPVCQVNVQQAFRSIAFMAETCVFAYLGMAIFSFKHTFHAPLIIWIIFLCFVGRALNIFPLSALANLFRQVTIDRKMQCIMWFSGLRGAIAFALALTLDFSEEKRSVLVSTTLVIVLFTILFLGSSTLPLVKFLNANTDSLDDKFTMSKTEDQREAVDAEHFEENIPSISMRGFSQFDIKYLIPFFRRKFTPAEMLAGRHEMQALTEKWYTGLTGHSEMGSLEEHQDLTAPDPVHDETSL
ncbi:sodium/hydrogen exchanger 8-like isoform X2 [Sycon ciliatum]|uniref:sodium/hydrogen exchanger 8-like isoform X2 n=1 Tax=Sycon ciliatum TaxID=27933 RepID=UPI0020AE091C|eukprot:scpid47021/ scgid0092/ Sodium/hydrogen exchanger 8; Na(+)/H(+) exchanger 8; Solute carrier family 9 member 8